MTAKSSAGPPGARLPEQFRIDPDALNRLLSELAILAVKQGPPAPRGRSIVASIAKATGFDFVDLEIPSASLSCRHVARPVLSPSGVLTSVRDAARRATASGRSQQLKPGGGLRWGVAFPLRPPGCVTGSLTLGTRRPVAHPRAMLAVGRRIAAVAEAFAAQICSNQLATQSLRKFELLFEGVPDAVLIIDFAGGTIIDANSETARITGWSRKELVGRPMTFLFSAAYKRAYRQLIRGLKQDPSLTSTGPLEIVKKSGKTVPVTISAGLAAEQDGEVMFAMLYDLTEQTKTAVKLQASEELLRIIVEGTLDMFFYVRNAKGEFTYLSPSVTKITGYPPAKLKRVYDRILTRNPINSQVRTYVSRALRRGTVAPAYLTEIRHAQGPDLLLEVNERPIMREGRVIGLQGVARDITERKRLEEVILESRDNLNRIVDQIPLGVMISDSAGNVTDVNEAFVKMFGVGEKGAVVDRLNVFRSPFFRIDNLFDRVREAIAGRAVDIPSLTADTRTIIPGDPQSGTERTFHVRIFPVIGRSGHLTNVVTMFEDVTERRHLEAQLIESQKMESIGFLAGGIAHDFNNILGGILGYASFIKKRTEKDHIMYPHLETIERSAMRAADLVSQLLAFARGGKYVVAPLAINDVLVETSGLLKGTIDTSIIIETELDPFSPVIEADAAQMQQVLMNLCVNARDAMPEGGTLLLRTVLLKTPDAYLQTADPSATGQFVRIDIQDTGMGIDATIKGKIFDPFFTTKEKGKGTGLGLATVYGIVKNHGGHTRVESEVGKGTTFSVYLPAVEAQLPPVKQSDVNALGGEERILIVDDEPTIRTLLQDILTEMGYRVMSAAGGMEAIAQYGPDGGKFDLVILDMAMPGLSGKETFEKLKSIDPNVRVILSTGYSEDERARELLRLGVRAFVQKPYRVDDLAAAVRGVLDAGHSGGTRDAR
jgi:two-component system cell cycle sensor histidine kinase/response regulator CckA